MRVWVIKKNKDLIYYIAHLYKNSEHSNEMEQIRIAAGLRTKDQPGMVTGLDPNLKLKVVLKTIL